MTTCVSVLGGDIWDDNGTWRSNGLDGPGDAAGVTLDRFRVIAAAYLMETRESNDVLTYIAQGGTEKDTRPSIASVLRRELIDLGVPLSAILVEEVSQSSYTQLLELQKIVIERKPDRIKIISNEWHIPRLEAMLATLDVLSELRALNPEFVTAEEVLVRTHPKEWGRIIEEVRTRPDVQARIEKEKRGVTQINDGTYQFH
jgi:hypothetical protein